jgi:hypothetical protein
LKALVAGVLGVHQAGSIVRSATGRQSADFGRAFSIPGNLLGFVVQSLGSHRRSSSMRASAGSRSCAAISADVAQSVELRFCKPEVRGSSPLVSSKAAGRFFCSDGARICDCRLSLSVTLVPMVGCPSGQWERAVNPPAYAYGGSNPPPTTSPNDLRPRVERSMCQLGWQADSDSAIGRAPYCGSSSVGRASAFQAERRGFESLLPLQSSSEDMYAVERFAPSVCPPSSDGRARPW